MRKYSYVLTVFVVFVLMIAVATSCKNGAPGNTDGDRDSTLTDSMYVDPMSDNGLESVMPNGADELFDDFFFNFAANKRLQYQRIEFPLSVSDGKQMRKLNKNQWQMDYFFMEQGYYTLIFDDIKQLDIVNDTSVNHVVVERINLNTHSVKQYVFDRKGGLWMMTSVAENTSYQNANASFLQFYEKFSTDEEYQIKSMDNLVTFTGPDPDDDFGSITGQISPEQWPAFRPTLIPEGTIYNIIYGQHYSNANQKVLVIRGIADGMETMLGFKKKGQSWKLVNFNC